MSQENKNMNCRNLTFTAILLLLAGFNSVQAGTVTTTPANDSHKIIVAKDGTVVFTANPDNGTVTVSITAENGASSTGSGNSRTVTFGSSTEGKKSKVDFTVTHTVGSTTCASNKKFTFYVTVPKIKTETIATKPSDRTRSSVGVGEEVNLSLEPSDVGALDWEITETDVATVTPANGNTTKMTVKGKAGSAVINVKKSGTIVGTKTMTVVTPASETATKDSDITSYPAGTEGVGMELTITVGPTTVSFANVEMLEKSGPASNISGYFTTHTPPSHTANATWIQLNADNKWRDTAALSGAPSPWSVGGFEWDIPVKWRVKGTTTENSGIPNRLQRFDIKGSSGETTVSKLGVSATRTP